MTKLSDLFDIKCGIMASGLDVNDSKTDIYNLMLVRPSNQQLNSIVGYVKESDIKSKDIYSKNTLYVSTDGEGSHTFSYISAERFVPNSNISVLIPKIDMTCEEKLFYSMCITSNRYKFSYGRKPKGQRLEDIEVPELSEIPLWLDDVAIPDYIDWKESKVEEDFDMELHPEDWKEFKLDELFKIKRGYAYNKNTLPIFTNSKNKIKCITRTTQNNGLDYFANNNDSLKKEEGNCLTIGAEGIQCFYQADNFVCGTNITILRNDSLNLYNALFICSVINNYSKGRFNYGFAFTYGRIKNCAINLPVSQTGEPDWNYMEEYIKRLPFSKNI